MQKLKERNINPNILETIKIDYLEERLTEYEIIYNTNTELNRELISKSGSDIKKEIIYTINRKTKR